MDYFIGIDVGTSKTKSVLFDARFNQLEVASVSNRTLTPAPGHQEQQMEALWQNVVSTLKTLSASSLLAKGTLRGIGLSGQGEGAWLIDKRGQPLRDALLWSDTRAASSIRELAARDGLEDKLFELCGSHLLPCNSSLQLRWLLQHQPERLEDAQWFFFAKDWIRFRLTGRANLELTDAGTSLLDLHQGTLSDTVLSELGIENLRPLFPPLLAPHDLAGELSTAAAAATGLPAGTPVAAGALDVSACALGIGAVHDGDVFTLLGTTCCTGIVCHDLTQVSRKTRFVSHAWQGQFLNLFAMQSGTPNLDWAISHLAANRSFSELGAEISALSPGSGGVFYQPYLNGERAPFYSPVARAGFFGISQDTTNAHLLRAVFEGLAWAITDVLSDYPPGGDLYLAGGGTASPFWLQIIADCTGRRVIVSPQSEPGARGAAILAAMALGQPVSAESLQPGDRQIWHPDARSHIQYQRLFPVFRQLREQLLPVWQARDDALTQLAQDSADL
ncbi:FGGY-family carbohydrate kinase [Pantoea coffeiphila]|uniref:Carbohydrate kinase n=1 Tax=Pantoea coffeiphila TaxID=1465635 RepID=A0A2S9IEN9_9GAMM|nr:FGGY-family carbohydrate kinase [Pantoea coffeiphila]PRD16214.1 carbohydrate kinase [Pantoea coffeiphila]